MAESGTRGVGPELLISLQRESAQSLRSQLEAALREQVRSGALRAGAVMPSTRTLAADLGVSRRLVLESYEQLVAEGYLISKPRRRTTVAALAPGKSSPAPRRQDRPQFDLRPRTSDLAQFPRREWARALGRAVREAPDGDLSYPDPQGAHELRVALGFYLRRVRGVVADPERILVCGGFTQALGLITRILRAGGEARIAVEDPGLVDRDRIIAAAGGECVPVRVDALGLDVAELQRSGAGAALVTPAHQFPTGVLMTPERRGELLQWAREGGVVIEDDYDAEFRYDRTAIGALQGLAPEQTVYVGSVSKTLAPALRLGWIVAPADLIGPLTESKRLDDQGAPTLDQLALAELIENGTYDRHLRLQRRRLRRRRDLLLDQLRRALPGVGVTGAAAGLHVVVALPGPVSMQSLLDDAAAAGVGLAPISRYCLANPVDPHQLVIGYGGVADAAIPKAVRLLAGAVAP